MIRQLKHLKKSVIWLVLISIVAGGGAIAWYARPSPSLNYSVALKVFSMPYFSIPCILGLIAFVVFIVFKKKIIHHRKER